MTPDASPAALARALAAVDPDIELVACWVDEDFGVLVAAMYAYPAARLAGLRHWIDEVPLAAPFPYVQAMEASKWARLALKSHGGALERLSTEATYDPRGQAKALRAIARRCVDDVADAWCEAADLPALPRADEPLSGQARFDALNGWLEALRAEG